MSFRELESGVSTLEDIKDQGLVIRPLGLVEYEPTWRAMQAFTATRTADTPDEFWVLELAAQYGMPHQVRPISKAEVRGADELWMASSPKEVLAIVTLDGEVVGDGKPGPMVQRMDALYQQYKAEVMRA